MPSLAQAEPWKQSSTGGSAFGAALPLGTLAVFNSRPSVRFPDYIQRATS